MEHQQETNPPEADRSGHVPLWLSAAGEEECADLDALGISEPHMLRGDICDGMREAPALSQAQRDAIASTYLRRMGEAMRDAQGLEESCAAEVMVIRARYAGAIERLGKRARTLQDAVQALALEADFGKAKSRTVAFGQYGRKLQPEKIIIQNQVDFIAWAMQAPERLPLVRVELKLPLSVAREYFTESELAERKAKYDVLQGTIEARYKNEQELPPGVARLLEQDAPFAKPELQDFSLLLPRK